MSCSPAESAGLLLEAERRRRRRKPVPRRLLPFCSLPRFTGSRSRPGGALHFTPAMQRPPAEVRGRLSYRPGWRGPRLSLFHLKLTDSALRALLTCQRLQVGLWAEGRLPRPTTGSRAPPLTASYCPPTGIASARNRLPGQPRGETFSGLDWGSIQPQCCGRREPGTASHLPGLSGAPLAW